MNYKFLYELLSDNIPASIRIFKSPLASLMLSFFYEVFKKSHQNIISNAELIDLLHDYANATAIEFNHDTLRCDLDQAKRWIDHWSNEGYLRKYPNQQGLDIHELTADTERVLQWLSAFKPQAFIGTESRFKHILFKLNELVTESQQSPEDRIIALEQKRREIDEQIRAIQMTGSVKYFTNLEVEERCNDIYKNSQEILADFKQIEYNLKQIAFGIYEHKSEEIISKGVILGNTLDARTELESSQQGQSFRAFWEFIANETHQEELNDLIASLHKILEKRQLSLEEQEKFLKKLKPNLLEAGQKVLDSNRLLIEKLSRALAEKSLLERQKATELINEIKQLAIQKMIQDDSTTQHQMFIEIETQPMIHMPMVRPLTEIANQAEVILKQKPQLNNDQELNLLDLTALYNPFEINKQHLIEKIEALLQHRSQVTLLELLEEFPLEKGLSELLSYFWIASNSSKHIIYKDIVQKVKFKSIHQDDVFKQINIPMIVFVK